MMTMMTDDDDDDRGEATPGETPSSGSSKVYSHGPSSLISAPLAPSRHPMIQPCGEKYVTNVVFTTCSYDMLKIKL
jgi:hypothetical protein